MEDYRRAIEKFSLTYLTRLKNSLMVKSLLSVEEYKGKKITSLGRKRKRKSSEDKNMDCEKNGGRQID